MCRLFYHSLSPLLGVGGLGGSSASGLLDICVCLHAHGGSSDADARLVFVCVVFSSQPSAAGKSLCLSVLIVLEGNDAGPACSRKKNLFFSILCLSELLVHVDFKGAICNIIFR